MRLPKRPPGVKRVAVARDPAVGPRSRGGILRAMFYLPSLLVVGLQVACAVHAVRHGRSSWLWLIVLFPVVGSLVYVLSEVRVERVGRDVAAGVVHAVAPSRRLRAMREQLEHCDTVENRMALAAESLAQGFPDEAIRLYESCREGVFRDDPVVLESLAKAYVETGGHAQARETLEQLFRSAPRRRTAENRLLMARAHEGLGATDDAVAEYREIAGQGIGDEARCRYALLLERLGQDEDARAIFARIVADARRSPSFYRRANREWIAISTARAKKRKQTA
jgi:hypothetical protein